MAEPALEWRVVIRTDLQMSVLMSEECHLVAWSGTVSLYRLRPRAPRLLFGPSLPPTPLDSCGSAKP